ncbi:MAG: Cold-active alkaline serine protease [Candidatus Brocadiaceae bacterium]|nr:Cold-active alkaline serine protease [Candidatus Brocadiaceae bacterium]
MKWILSVVLAMLVTLFCVDFAPVNKSVVYAQSLPGEAGGAVEEKSIGEFKAKKIVACDGFGFTWTFKISKKGKIKGKVQTTNCGVRTVTGTYNKNTQAITLVATTTPTESCCKSFTYTGTFNTTTKSGSGTWVNSSECSGSGTWTMSACQ